jgi:hypothetical protein
VTPLQRRPRIRRSSTLQPPISSTTLRRGSRRPFSLFDDSLRRLLVRVFPAAVRVCPCDAFRRARRQPPVCVCFAPSPSVSLSSPAGGLPPPCHSVSICTGRWLSAGHSGRVRVGIHTVAARGDGHGRGGRSARRFVPPPPAPPARGGDVILDDLFAPPIHGLPFHLLGAPAFIRRAGVPAAVCASPAHDTALHPETPAAAPLPAVSPRPPLALAAWSGAGRLSPLAWGSDLRWRLCRVASAYLAARAVWSGVTLGGDRSAVHSTPPLPMPMGRWPASDNGNPGGLPGAPALGVLRAGRPVQSSPTFCDARGPTRAPCFLSPVNSCWFQ